MSYYSKTKKAYYIETNFSFISVVEYLSIVLHIRIFINEKTKDNIPNITIEIKNPIEIITIGFEINVVINTITFAIKETIPKIFNVNTG